MSFIEEHFDAEIAVLLAVCGGFWGLLKHNDSQEKEHLKQWLTRLESSIVEMRIELREIIENSVSEERISKMDDEIAAMQKEIGSAREKAVSIERITKLDLDFQVLRDAIQKIREAIIRSATKEKEDLRRTEESIIRLEKKIDLKLDERTCNMFRDKKS